MDFFNTFDWSVLWNTTNLFYIALGSLFGIIVGAMPGLGANIGCALMIPLTYGLEAIPAILVLMSVYMGVMYGGSISAIALGIPGSPSAVVTVLDGNSMAKDGYPGKAMGYSLYSSTFGGFIGGIALVLVTSALAAVSLLLSDPELFLIGMLGLLSVASLGVTDIPKFLMSIVLGLFLGTIGMDMFTGTYRYTFGNIYLVDGINLAALMAGVYALGEVFEMVMEDLNRRYVTDLKNTRCHISLKEFLKVKWVLLKSSVIGVVFGVVPGLGAGAATWFTYMQAKRDSKHPELFGKGSPEGLAAAESTNNAVVGGALAPMLALGIPGSSTVAIIAAAMMIHGLQPGINLFKERADLVYAIYVGIFIATIFMFIFGKYLTTLFARMLVCPNYILVPIVTIALMVGAYCARNYFTDVWIAIIAGAAVFFLKRLDFSISAFTLAFILASLIENHFRRSLMLSKGSASIFFTRPAALIIWVLIGWMIFVLIRQSNKNKKKKGAKTEESAN